MLSRFFNFNKWDEHFTELLVNKLSFLCFGLSTQRVGEKLRTHSCWIVCLDFNPWLKNLFGQEFQSSLIPFSQSIQNIKLRCLSRFIRRIFSRWVLSCKVLASAVGKVSLLPGIFSDVITKELFLSTRELIYNFSLIVDIRLMDPLLGDTNNFYTRNFFNSNTSAKCLLLPQKISFWHRLNRLDS